MKEEGIMIRERENEGGMYYKKGKEGRMKEEGIMRRERENERRKVL